VVAATRGIRRPHPLSELHRKPRRVRKLRDGRDCLVDIGLLVTDSEDEPQAPSLRVVWRPELNHWPDTQSPPWMMLPGFTFRWRGVPPPPRP